MELTEGFYLYLEEELPSQVVYVEYHPSPDTLVFTSMLVKSHPQYWGDLVEKAKGGFIPLISDPERKPYYPQGGK